MDQDENYAGEHGTNANRDIPVPNVESNNNVNSDGVLEDRRNNVENGASEPEREIPEVVISANQN